MTLVQVKPDGRDWKIVLDGTEDAATFDTIEEAEEQARDLARQLGAEFQVHDADGSVHTKDRYEKYPRILFS